MWPAEHLSTLRSISAMRSRLQGADWETYQLNDPPFSPHSIYLRNDDVRYVFTVKYLAFLLLLNSFYFVSGFLCNLWMFVVLGNYEALRSRNYHHNHNYCCNIIIIIIMMAPVSTNRLVFSMPLPLTVALCLFFALSWVFGCDCRREVKCVHGCLGLATRWRNQHTRYPSAPVCVQLCLSPPTPSHTDSWPLRLTSKDLCNWLKMHWNLHLPQWQWIIDVVYMKYDKFNWYFFLFFFVFLIGHLSNACVKCLMSM